MKNQSSGKTKVAFFLFLASTIYISQTVSFSILRPLFDYISPVFDPFINLFVGPWFVMTLFSPFIVTPINICGIVFQIIALSKGESKVKNILMMVFTVLYEVASIWFFIRFWKGAMSV